MGTTMPVAGGDPLQTSDRDAIISTPGGQGLDVIATANRYTLDDPDWNGALLEETSAFRGDIELFTTCTR